MQKALAPEILTWPAENPQLIGGQCGDCGATTFPAQPRCPRCSGGQMSELLLPRRGIVVAWTKYGIGIAVGLDKHPRGAFTDDPAKLALP